MNVNKRTLALALTPLSLRSTRVKKHLSAIAIGCLAVFGAATVSAQPSMSPAERPAAQPGATEQTPGAAGGIPANRQPSDQQVGKQFQAADANGDGRLSKEEAKTSMPGVFRNFERIDTKGQDFITQEDLLLAMKR